MMTSERYEQISKDIRGLQDLEMLARQRAEAAEERYWSGPCDDRERVMLRAQARAAKALADFRAADARACAEMEEEDDRVGGDL